MSRNVRAGHLGDEHGHYDAVANLSVGSEVASSPAGLSLLPLLNLSRELRATLVPREVRLQFRDELYRSLVAEARRRQAAQALGLGDGQRDFRERVLDRLRVASAQRRSWVIGAAAVGSAASLVGIGVLAYVRRRRRRAA